MFSLGGKDVHTLICFLIIYPILFPVTYCQFVRVQGRSKLSELKQNSNFPDCKVAHFLLAMTCNFQASSPRLSLIPPPYMYYNIFLAWALYYLHTCGIQFSTGNWWFYLQKIGLYIISYVSATEEKKNQSRNLTYGIRTACFPPFNF